MVAQIHPGQMLLGSQETERLYLPLQRPDSIMQGLPEETQVEKDMTGDKSLSLKTGTLRDPG